MKPKQCKPVALAATRANSKPGSGVPWSRRRAPFVLLGGAAAIAVLLMLLDPGGRLGQRFVYSAVYSLVIGGAAYWAMPYTWAFSARFPAPGLWAIRLGLLLAIGTAGTLLADALFLAIGWIRYDAFWRVYGQELKIAMFFTLVTGSVITVYESMRAQLDQNTLDLRTKELERERALKLAGEARLSSLESRIHPHFLFNALNSVSALIREDPPRAERLIEQISALLRFSLDADRSSLVPLHHEMKIVRDYLEIEATRFGPRLRFQIEIEPGAGTALVPPLAIQTLVENSVKFAVAPNRTGGDIDIRAIRSSGPLQIVVSDSGPGFDLAAVPDGHGIDILRGRLSALFGTAAGLHVERAGAVTSITITIPQNGVPQ